MTTIAAVANIYESPGRLLAVSALPQMLFCLFEAFHELLVIAKKLWNFASAETCPKLGLRSVTASGAPNSRQAERKRHIAVGPTIVQKCGHFTFAFAILQKCGHVILNCAILHVTVSIALQEWPTQ
mmetsp:Transcript_43917/g.98400  ORF Transcript_43917/g.98400 Transcript_43917/m.98400 type:complete len:126 (-) Transcript_43917:472-849(-)